MATQTSAAAQRRPLGYDWRMDTARPSLASRARAFAIAGGLLLLSLAAARASSGFIGQAFPDRPAPRDLLFELIPYAAWAPYAADAVLFASGALLVWHAQRRLDAAPGMLALLAVMETARAAINVLTPLASPLGNGTLWGLVRFVQNGMFTSGHTGSAFLFYLLVDREEAPRLKRVLLGLLVAECTLLIVGRGHYTIDIVGGLLLTYVLHDEWMHGRALAGLKRLVTP